jgi:hypothetical protein
VRLDEQVEVIDEAVDLYHRVGRLVGFTSSGRLIMEVGGRSRIDLDAHQVDVAGRFPSHAWPSTPEFLEWIAS